MFQSARKRRFLEAELIFAEIDIVILFWRIWRAQTYALLETRGETDDTTKETVG